VAQPASDFWPVGSILELFKAAGCEVREAEPIAHLSNGDCLNVRYLLAPDGKNFVPLVDLADTDSVSELEVAFWERRLGIQIGRPRAH
jgi:hypothetical protein